MISRERLDELKEILEEDYGQDFSPEEVAEIGRRLVNFFKLLAEFDRRDRSEAAKTGKPGDAGVKKMNDGAEVAVGTRSCSGT